VSAPRSALLVGFARGLQAAIGDLLERHGFTVDHVPGPEHAASHVRTAPPSLLVITGRCGVDGLLTIMGELQSPRRTRIVVLLPGPDPVAERQYRAAGVRVVLRMPVGAEDLLRRAGVGDADQT
jgi:ActR/RegA family two-component response regulator